MAEADGLTSVDRRNREIWDSQNGHSSNGFEFELRNVLPKLHIVMLKHTLSLIVMESFCVLFSFLFLFNVFLL